MLVGNGASFAGDLNRKFEEHCQEMFSGDHVVSQLFLQPHCCFEHCCFRLERFDVEFGTYLKEYI